MTYLEAFAASAPLVVVSGSKKTVEFIDQSGSATGVAFSPDGSLCAVSLSVAPYLKVLRTDTWEDVGVTPLLSNSANKVAFSPDGSLCAVSHYGAPFLTVYSTSNWAKVPFTTGLSSTCKSVTFSPNGSLCAVATEAAPYMVVFDTATWTQVALTPSLPGGGQDVSFSPDGSLCAVAHSYSPGVTVFNTATWGKVSLTGGTINGTCNSVSFSNDGALMAVTGQPSPFLILYSTATWAKTTIPSNPVTTTAYCAKFSPDDKLLFYGATNPAPRFGALNTSDWSHVNVNAMPYGAVRNSQYLRDCAFYVPEKRVISGNVRDINGDLVQRNVRAYQRDTGQLCAETLSDALTGAYELALFEGDVEYDIQFQALDAESLNDLFYARVTSGTP